MKELYDVLDAVTGIMIEKMFVPVEMDVGSIGLLIHRRKGAYGYCHVVENWKINDSGLREIGITDVALLAGVDEVLTTLAHELVHASNIVAGIKDCSGPYHNKKFAIGCDKIGLKYEKHNKHGYITPRQFPMVFCEIMSALTDEQRATLDNVSVLLEADKKKQSKDRNLKVHVCPNCGAKARATITTSLICGSCVDEFGEIMRMEVQV